MLGRIVLSAVLVLGVVAAGAAGAPRHGFGIGSGASDPIPLERGVTILWHGKCRVDGGIKTQTGAPVKAWDFWQEIFQTGAPTWLAAHTHHGAECIMNVQGVTSWWFAHRTDAPDSPPTIVPVHRGETVYTVQGRVHTAGDVGPEKQAYLGIHVLEQGSNFNYPVDDPSAPPQSKTEPLSIFKNELQYQVPSKGTFTIYNYIISMSRNATYHIFRFNQLGYYTVFEGGAMLNIPGRRPEPMVKGKMLLVPRDTAATITTRGDALLAVTQLR